MTKRINIQAIVGSIREGRNGEKVLKWFSSLISKREDANFELIDLKEWNLPMFSEAASPMMGNGKYANEMQQKWGDKIREGDAYIIITPEYNHGYPASVKNALDYLYAEWNKKPVSFISYGGISGGVRAVEQLRNVAVELQMIPVRQEVNIPLVWQAFDEEGELKNSEMHEERANAMIEQLLWFAELLKNGRG